MSVLDETAFAAVAPAVNRPASCDQLEVEPVGHQSMPPFSSLPICTMSAVVPCALRALRTSWVWSYTSVFNRSYECPDQADGMVWAPGSVQVSE